MECVCHVITAPAKVETVMRIATLEKKERLLKFAREWSRLDKQPELEIALQIISNNSEHISEDSVYHQSCFLRFASSSHVEKASKSKRKRVSKSRFHSQACQSIITLLCFSLDDKYFF